MRSIRLLPLAALAGLGLATQSRADVVVTVAQAGGDVVFESAGGTLDLTGLSFFDTNTYDAQIAPSSSAFLIGASASVEGFLGLTPPSAFGSSSFFFADSGMGPLVGAYATALYVPTGYESGTPLGPFSAVFADHTYDSLGFDPAGGTFTWTWDADSVSLVIAPAAPVPVPATVWLFGSALGFLGWLRRKAAC